MKNIIILCVLFACVFTTGCAQTIVSGTFRTLNVPTEVGMSPIAADLRVSEQRTQGVAQGKVRDSAFLYDEALANALGQNPPTPEGPDILVAGDLFAERRGSKLTLTITGYPAWYHNFRTVDPDDGEFGDSAFLLIPGRLAGTRTRGVMPSLTTLGGMRSQEQNVQQRERSNVDHILGVRWQPTDASPIGFNLEYGQIRNNKWLWSIDLGGGWGGDDLAMLGGTFNIGGVWKFSDKAHFAYGGSAGFWFREYVEEYRSGYYGNEDEWRSDNGIAGPFFRLRFSVFEVTYRYLFGLDEESLNQLLIGFHF